MLKTILASLILLTSFSVENPTLADLSWMSGDWQTAPGGRRQIEEHWTTAAGGSMMGVSRTVAGDKTVEFEYLRIESRPDGLYYVAQPGGRPPTSFKLTKWDGTEAVFENPEHDFPRRIIYRKQPDNVVVVRIDGGAGTKGEDFTFKP